MHHHAVRKPAVRPAAQSTDMSGPGKALLAKVKSGEIEDILSMHRRRELSDMEFKDTVFRGLCQTIGDYEELRQLFRLDSLDTDGFVKYLKDHGCHFEPKIFAELLRA